MSPSNSDRVSRMLDANGSPPRYSVPKSTPKIRTANKPTRKGGDLSNADHLGEDPVAVRLVRTKPLSRNAATPTSNSMAIRPPRDLQSTRALQIRNKADKQISH